MNRILFTHNDLDGVMCSILAKLVWRNRIDIVYCKSPSDCTYKLSQTRIAEYSDIYVTDISFDYESIPFDINISKINIFDHHTTAKPLKQYFPNANIYTEYNNRLTCGAELFYNYLHREFGLSINVTRFVELTRLYDTWEWAKLSDNTPYKLAMLLDMLGIDKFVMGILQKVHTGASIFNKADLLLLNYEEKRRSLEIENQLKQVFIVSTADNLKLGVYIGNADVSALGNAICDKYNVDIAAIINIANRTISTRTTRDNIKLGELMKTEYAGGGHDKSAGGRLTIVNSEVTQVISILLDFGFGYIYNVRKATDDDCI